MKTSFFIDLLKATRRRRFVANFIIKILRTLKTKKKVKLPRKMSDAEKIAVGVFMRLIQDTESKLYYDIHSQECYVKSPDGSIYLFLEERNLKAINTIIGYDIPLQLESEQYLAEKFVSELNKRRVAFKQEAMEKVDYSLHKTFDKILNK
jgi:hypothetical protein